MSKSRLCLLLAILACFFFSFAIAQSSLSGAIAGKAWYAHASARDAAHHIAVSDVQITLQSADTSEHFQAGTDANGVFLIQELKPGDYSLRATASGLAALQLHVTAEVGRITEVELPFSLANANEVVEVRSEAPAVNTTQPDFASNVTRLPSKTFPATAAAGQTSHCSPRPPRPTETSALSAFVALAAS